MTSNFLPLYNYQNFHMMAEDKNIFSYRVLSNGLRIIHRESSSSVEYCGLAVKVGSRNEAPHQYGLAHFVEHTIFKGTEKRRSWHIINRMESVGGEINAYTSEEVTMIYSAFPKGNLTRAVDLIADLVAHSCFPQNEIDREREVVLDEIDSYLDSPAEAIFDDFNDLMFAGSSLGHNILGNADTINSFTSQTCRDFLSRYYTPGNMVFFYMGPTPVDRVVKVTEKFLGPLDHTTETINHIEPKVNEPFDRIRKLNTHQSHTVIGARIPGMFGDKNRVYALLTNIIGGPCMNSLLNVALRERHGYVYSVDAYSSLFTDCGLFSVYFGCDEEHVKPCRRLIFNAFDRLASSAVTPKALYAAKKQYLGQSAVASDNREQLVLSLGRAMLFNGYAAPASEIVERIMSITGEDLRMAAEKITRSHCSVLTFG